MHFHPVCSRLPLLFLLVLSGIGCARSQGLHQVERVVDGDTFVLTGGERVRLIGIDTPETVHPNKPVEPFGPEASGFSKNMLEGKDVRLEFDVQERDKYGRLLAYVFLEDDTFVNAELLRLGFAVVLTIPPNVKHAEQFLELQREAREHERGLWSY